jgi:hypothetical protein
MFERASYLLRYPRGRALLAGAFLGLGALPLAAQQAAGGGVGGPGLLSDSVPLSRTVPEKEQVQDEMGRARMRLGPARVLPSFSVWNAGYDSNVFGTAENQVSDWTISVNAGATFLVPLGNKFVFRADAFPQYTWWRELTERDRFGGRYNGSVYGFFNRMTVEFDGGYFEQYHLYSSEVDTQVFQKSITGTAKVDVQLTSRLGLFGSGGYQDVNYDQIEGPPDQEVRVPINDRTAWGGRGGLRYNLSPDWSVGAVGEGTWADFKITPEIRNNTSNAALMSVNFNRPRFFVNLLGGWRQGTGVDPTYFLHYSTGVGSFFVSYFPISWLELQGLGHRQVAYSLTLTNPYYFENRIGGKVNIQVGPRILLSGYGTTGPNNYPRAQPVVVDGETVLLKRRDEALQYGGGFSIIVYRPIVLSARATHTSFDSNVETDNRSYTRYTVMISFSGTFQR